MTSKTLITEVDLPPDIAEPKLGGLDGGSSPASSLKGPQPTAAGRIGGQFPFRTALRVEDEVFEWKGANVPTRLPESVNLDTVMSSVVDTVEFPNAANQNDWVELFSRPESKAMMNDTFWWFFCDRFAGARWDKEGKRNEAIAAAAEESKTRLFDRVSKNFVHLFFSTEAGTKDAFFTRYWDSLAQVVYLSFYVAYPKSRVRFDDQFKTNLVDKCAEWTTGMRPSVPSWSHWSLDFDPISKSKARVIKRNTALNQRFGESMGNYSRKTSSGVRSSFARRTRAASSTAEEERTAPRKLHRYVRVNHTLTHSPLVQRFVEQRGCSNVQLACRVTLTEEEDRPLTLVAEEARRASEAKKQAADGAGFQRSPRKKTHEASYSLIAREAEAKRKQLLRDFRSNREKTNKELQRCKREGSRAQDSLKKERKDALRGDVHEFSNFLVSSSVMV